MVCGLDLGAGTGQQIETLGGGFDRVGDISLSNVLVGVRG